MIASRERMFKLMAYVDGELDGAERADVERWLAEDADAARFANELTDLSDLVVLGRPESAEAKAVLSFDVADAVMAKVDAARPKGEIVSLDRARDRRQHRMKLGAAAVAAALALAASVFIIARPREEQPIARAPATVVQPAASAGSGAGSGPGVEVETAGSSVSVFYLPSESTLTTSVVVWVDETGEKK